MPMVLLGQDPSRGLLSSQNSFSVRVDDVDTVGAPARSVDLLKETPMPPPSWCSA